MKKFFLVYLFFLCNSPSLYGEKDTLHSQEGYAFTELYEIQVELSGTDRESINEGMKLAFHNLMLSLSSNSDISNYPAIVQAVNDPEKYISEYKLSSISSNILAIFYFDGAEVRKLLSKNSLPLWIGIKPKVLLFLPCKSESFLIVDEREILVKRQKKCSEISSEINSRASMRNIVFIEPLIDLLDLKYLDLYKPRSDQNFLNKISSRYGLKDWMVCYIQNEYGLLITEPFCQSSVLNFKRISLTNMIDVMADKLFKDFQLNIDHNIRNELKIAVTGVEGYKDLLAIERIIEFNALIEEYSIWSISNNTVTYSLSTRGQVTDLEKLMNVNPLLTNQSSQRNGIDLEYLYKIER